jgi:excinuclease ABC subunit C
MEYRIQQMSRSVADIRWLVQKSELHALLLEDRLIKKHWPTYNERQKKFLRNCYLALTDEEYPRLEILAIDDHGEGQTVFGPFPDHFFVLDLLEIVYAVYPIRHCDGAVTEARCQNYKLQNCSAPCRNRIARSQYTKIVNQVMCFLNGDTREAIRGLQNRMEESTKLLDFERAATLRDQMTFCKAFMKRQKFYDQFRKKDLVIKEWGPSRNIYLFCKGDLVGYAKAHITHDELVKAARKKGKSMEVEGKEPETRFRDRANVVYGWLKNKRTPKTHEFI